MITPLLQMQLNLNTEFIYANIYNFVEHFFPETAVVEVDMMARDEISYYITYEHNHVYMQKHWVSKDGQDNIQECHIDYPEYNEWWASVNDS